MYNTPKYRTEHRAKHPQSTRSLVIEIIVTNLAVIALMAYFIRGLEGPSWIAWLALPASFLGSNLIEYVVHRWVLHRKRAWAGFAFERHAVWHHGFYTDKAMDYERFSDCHLVFFPIFI